MFDGRWTILDGCEGKLVGTSTRTRSEGLRAIYRGEVIDRRKSSGKGVLFLVWIVERWDIVLHHSD